MRSAPALSLLLLSACRGAPEPPATVPIPPPLAAPAAAPAPRPPIDLDPSLQLGAFTPGRFANALQRSTHATHARQVVSEDGTSSFVLDLKPGGAATLCRGWRYQFFNDGPKIHTEERLREQLGYQGRWEQREGWVQIDLTVDDSVCGRIGEYSHLVPDHAPQWHLRCLPLVSKNPPLGGAPLLACRTDQGAPAFGEDEPHGVDEVLPGWRLVLGAGKGLRVRVEARSVDGHRPPDVRLELAPEAIANDAWQHAF